MPSSGRVVLLVSILTLFGSLPALAGRVDTAAGSYGINPNNFFGPSAITVSDSGGTALAEITSYGRCSSPVGCGFEASSTSQNFVYFYVVRVLRTLTGPLQLTIPGTFTLAAAPYNSASWGIITNDLTNIAACNTPESNTASLSACEGLYLLQTGSTTSTVSATQAVMYINNSGLQTGDTIEIYVASFVPPPCYADLNTLSSVDPSDCPATGQMTFALNGSTVTTSPSKVVVVAPIQPGVTPVTCPTPSGYEPPPAISPYCFTQQLNVNSVNPAIPTNPYDAGVDIPATSALALTISATTGGKFTINSNSTIYWNGIALASKYTAPSLTASVPATMLTSGGTATVTVETTGASPGTSNPIAYALLAPNPTDIAFTPGSTTQGSGPLLITLTGTGFVPNSIVQWNTSQCDLDDSLPTTYNASTKQLTATIPAAFLQGGVSTVTISVFAEPGTGTCSGYTGVADNPAGKTFGITAGSIPTLVPTSIAFGNQTVGTTSSATTITLTNNINAGQSLTIPSSSATGSNPGDFTIATSGTTCTNGKVLAAGASCTFALTFAPVHAGTRTATLQISNSSGNATLTVPLTGTGVSPDPTLTSIMPTSILAGSAAQTLTLNGTGFTLDSTVSFNGSNVTPTWMSAKLLTAAIPATLLTTAATAPVTVSNPSEGSPATGGGTTAPQTFTINNPVPTIATNGLSPSSATAGAGPVTLMVTGTNFATGATVSFNGTSITPTTVTSTLVTAVIPAPLLTTTGTVPVTVTNVTPGGGPSNTVSFTINNPVPTIATNGLSPSSTTVGAGPVTLMVTGTNFVAGATVSFNGTSITPTTVTSTLVTAVIPAPLLTTTGTVPVTVTNLAPGGGPSNTVSFTINNPVPTIATNGLSPSSTTAGAGPVTLMVTGTNFATGATVSFNGTSITPTTVTSMLVTAVIPAPLLTTAGTVPVTVTNLTPGGGPSNTVSFTINNPVPTIATNGLSPSSTTVGAGPVTLMVTGTNFVAGATVSFNGTSITPTTVTSTLVTAVIPAPLLTTTGTVPVTVTNLTPGGGPSNTVSFTINNPVPTIATNGLSPSSTTAGAGPVTLMVTGTNFATGATVSFNGTSITPTTVTSMLVTAVIPAPLLTTAGTVPVTVTNLTPGGGPSNTVSFTINNPVPTIATNGLSPSSTTAGAGPVTLMVTGTNFATGATVSFNGTSITPTTVTSMLVTAVIPAPLLTTAGTVPVTVTNLTPGGGPSNTVSFTINNPVPTIATNGLSPSSTTVGAGPVTLMVTGTNFVAGATVSFNGTSITPTTVTSTLVTAVIPAPLLTTAGTVPVTVTNLTPGGGPSNTLSFTINNPTPPMIAPVITSANSAAFMVSTLGSFTVTATGTPTPTLSESGALPSGVSFNAITGVLSGTPAVGTAGNYPITFTAENGVLPNASQSFTLNVAGTTNTESVPIQNAAFEMTNGLSSSCGTGCAYNFDVGIPDWTVTGDGGSFEPSSAYLTLPPADGQTIAYSDGGTISQVLTSTLQANSTYTLSVDVGHRLDGYTTNYTIELLAGGTVLNSITGNSSSITAGTLATQSVSYTSPATVTPGQLLEIQLISAGTQGDFGNVTLTVVSSTVSVPIQNASFEITNGLNSSCGTGCTYNSGVGIPDWTVTGVAGSFQPTSYLTLPPADGQTIAYSDGGTISQVLTATLQANSTYTLSVDVGHRLDGYATNYTIELLAGSTVLNSVTGNSASITAGTFATQTVSYTSPATVTPGQLLEIELISAGAQGDFDNVTLTVSPSVNQAPVITSANNTKYVVSVLGSFTVTATGTPTPTLSESGALPSGVSFNAMTGVLSGTPAAGTAGSYPITFTAQNDVLPNASQSFTLTVVASTTSVPVQNASFEITNGLNSSCGTGCTYNSGVGIPDWTVTGVAGSFQPTSYLTLPPADGQTIAYSDGGTISQVLTGTLQANSTYTLSVDVGHRLDGYATNYTIELLAGSTVLNSVTGNSASITAGTFATQTVSYTSPATVTPGQQLEIQLISAGIQGDFDNVTLTVY